MRLRAQVGRTWTPFTSKRPNCSAGGITMLSGRGIVRAILALILVLATSVLASIGDRSFKYQLCVFSCQQDTCRDHRPLPFTDDTIVASDPLPWYLVLTGWTCESNCEYHCTHRVTNEAQKRVQDIRSRVYAQLQQERDEAQALTLRWKKQLSLIHI
mgnify:CR=1 FL=1